MPSVKEQLPDPIISHSFRKTIPNPESLFRTHLNEELDSRVLSMFFPFISRTIRSTFTYFNQSQ